MSRTPSHSLVGPSARIQRGNTLLGLLIGIVIGLAIAAGVALYVTKAPVPFLSKNAAKNNEVPIAAPNRGAGTNMASDANRALIRRDSNGALSAPTGNSSMPSGALVTDTGNATNAAAAQANASSDPIGSFATSKAANTSGSPSAQAVVPSASTPPQIASAAPTSANASNADGKASSNDTRTRLALQTGAFRSQADADAMKARLALMGLDATVSTVERNGESLYRVRLGPFTRLDDLNRVRQTLAQNGVDASTVKPAAP